MKMSCQEIKRFPAGKRVAGKWVKQRVKAFRITNLKELLKKKSRKVDVYYE